MYIILYIYVYTYVYYIYTYVYYIYIYIHMYMINFMTSYFTASRPTCSLDLDPQLSLQGLETSGSAWRI